MKEWEKEVCRRNPEINQRRLNLLSNIDKSLFEMKAIGKFFDKKKLTKEEKQVVENRLREMDLLKDVQKSYTKNKEGKGVA